MGSYDGAECSELVGLYILHILVHVDKIFLPEDVVLFRDDGLGAVEGSGHDLDKIRKALNASFKRIGLKITCETNLLRVCFLDVLLDLQTGEHMPYIKKNSQLKYVQKGSNHPPNVTKNLPLNINRRLQNISSNQKCFNTERLRYQNALYNAGYEVELEYDRKYATKYNSSKRFNAPQYQHQNRNVKRSRQVIWYNPPFNLYCANKVGKEFRDICQKHFGNGGILGKLFNKNKLKLSYSCMGSLDSKISAHNRKVLEKTKTVSVGCNCQKKSTCPMVGQCNWSDIIYEAEVCLDNQSRGEGMIYVGQASGSWKLRYHNHTNSFRKIELRADTDLSNYVWDLKSAGKNHKIFWRKISQEYPYSKISKRCKLCSREKIEILKLKKKYPTRVLNKRTGLLAPCLHRNKHLLGKLDISRGNQFYVELEPQKLLGEQLQYGENSWGTTRSGKSWRSTILRNESDLPIIDNG